MAKDVTGEAAIGEVLQFWLEEVGPKRWYESAPELDALCRERMGGLAEMAAAGGFRDWRGTPEGTLALLILLDQIPRNIHRGTARAFAADRLALKTAKAAVRKGQDLEVAEPARQFFYLPLMHSESVADQDRSVRLCLMRLPETGEENVAHAIRHRDVIRRFGRFPSRNAALGRTDRAEEIAYRAAGGYMG